MGSGGAGGPDQAPSEYFKMETGTDMLDVPYRGLGPALADLLGGQVQLVFSTVPAAIEYIKGDRLRPLAVTTATRSEALPDVPTVGDFLPGFESSQLVRRRRAEGHARRYRRQAQQRDQRGTCRSQIKGTDRGSWRRTDADDARRFRQAHRSRNREMGQGDQIRRHQGEVTRRGRRG